MVKRGPKPKVKVKIEWSANFAYALGLLATDGCVSKDGRHVILTSKDIEQLENFMRCLSISCNLGKVKGSSGTISFRVQLSDVNFSEFLTNFGIIPAKSLVLGPLAVPDQFFFDFLRGCFDGDGSTYSYWDPRWRSSYMFYIVFSSASPKFIYWLKLRGLELAGLRGHIKSAKKVNICYQLCYSKYEAMKLAQKMYTIGCVHLSRKKAKIDESLSIIASRHMDGALALTKK